ncbi:MAG TPA: protease pro-enzyme activation domain-containing protein [Kofleriaceae bacterium]|nr:protease pro-enzyme activation domain-containing protein [Kofleriaceae bacterium]
MGQLPPDQTLHVDIVLPLRNEDELRSSIPELNDRSSPSYHVFFTPDELALRFGPSQDSWDQLVAFAQDHNLQVTGGSRAARDLRVVGAVEDIEQAFHVTLRTYQDATDDRAFYAPDREPTIALPFPVLHISGLDNYSIPTPRMERRMHTSEPQATTGSGPSASYLGSDMRAAYYGGTALTGAGQNVALLEYYGTDLADLSSYYHNVGQTEPFTPKLVSTDGTSTSCVAPSCDDTEQTLDMTQAMGMAPGMNMLYVYVGSTDTAIISAMTATTDAPLSKQISCSWGWTPADPSALDGYWETMAAQGQNFFAASGDASTWSSRNEAWPADAAYVVSVGGTDLTTTGAGGAWASETAWSDSGGGITPDSIAIPSWQTAAAGTCNSAGLGCSKTLRNGPDVSANANFTFYVCADQTTCTANEYGGTSFAAPMWAGYLALANQQAAANGDSIGFLDPILYPAAAGSSYGTLFHDITSGTSGSYKAGTGYDLVTGWGSPNTTGLINLLAGSTQTQPSFSLSSSPSSVAITQGGAAGTSTIAVTGAGGFSGAVTLSASGLPSGVTASFGTNPTTGSSVLSLSASATATTGTATVTITGTSGSLSATTTISLVVTAAATPSFSASASPSTVSVTQGAAGTSTITIASQNGFASAVTLSATGLPSGVTASFSANPVTPAANGSTTSTLTLTASSAAATGTTTVTITGTSGTQTHATTIALTVNPSSTGSATFTMSLSPASFTVADGGSVSTTLTLTSVGGFNSAVTLGVSSFPSGVSATASADPVTVPANGTAKVTLKWSATRRAPRGTSTVELIGTSGSTQVSIPVTITVAR